MSVLSSGNVYIQSQSGGSSYTSATGVLVQSPYNAVTTTVTVSAGAIQSIVVNYSINEYVTAPTAWIYDPTTSTKLVSVTTTIENGKVKTINLPVTNTGFTSSTVVSVDPPPSRGKRATIGNTISTGIVTFYVTDPGYGYESTPTANLFLTGGSSASLTLGASPNDLVNQENTFGQFRVKTNRIIEEVRNLQTNGIFSSGSSVSSVILTNTGTNYSSVPNVTFSAPDQIFYLSPEDTYPITNSIKINGNLKQKIVIVPLSTTNAGILAGQTITQGANTGLVLSKSVQNSKDRLLVLVKPSGSFAAGSASVNSISVTIESGGEISQYNFNGTISGALDVYNNRVVLSGVVTYNTDYIGYPFYIETETDYQLISFSEVDKSGETATGVAILNNDLTINRIDITHRGSRYINPPTVTIAAPVSGTQATGICTLTPKTSSVLVYDGYKYVDRVLNGDFTLTNTNTTVVSRTNRAKRDFFGSFTTLY